MAEKTADKKAEQIKRVILEDDLILIGDALVGFENYDFAKDVKERLCALGLSANELGKRCLVTHTIIGKWCSGAAKPHGKERMKELGMALAMNENDLNAFLFANCYPRLYAKSPLDNACKLVLRTMSGQQNIVQIYREFIDQYGLGSYTPSPGRLDIATTLMSRNFNAVANKTDFEKWLTDEAMHFGASAKAQMANTKLIRFIHLYIGSSTIYELYSVGELPAPIKSLLYPLVADREFAVRGLREKLIAFGLYYNMTEEEMDLMLGYANLRLFTEPRTLLEHAMLTALRCAHERYPYFELSGIQRMVEYMRGAIEQAADESEEARLREQATLYNEQLQNASVRVSYFDEHKNETDRLFEQQYTDYADRRIMDYMRDVLVFLAEDGILTGNETSNMLEVLR